MRIKATDFKHSQLGKQDAGMRAQIEMRKVKLLKKAELLE